MKKNWKAITVVLALALVVGGGIYWVHNIYLPARQAEKAEELRGATQDIEAVTPAPSIEATAYDYTIKVKKPTETTAPGAANTPTHSGDELDENSAAAAVANIGAGSGGNIVGEDGIYHGEDVTPTPAPTATVDPTATAAPAAPPAPAVVETTKPAQQETARPSHEPVQTVGPTPTPPPAIESVTPTATQATPTPTPVATATPSAPAQRPASNDSATPKQGDTRTVDGQQQMWVDGWGWVPVGSGGGSEPSKGTNTEIGEPVPNASFG